MSLYVVCKNNKQILDFLNKRVSAWISYEPFLVLDLNHPDYKQMNYLFCVGFFRKSLNKFFWTNVT